MIKKLFFLFIFFALCAAVISASIFFSRRVYVFYNSMYYGEFRKGNYDQYVQKAAELLKTGEKKEFEQLIDKIFVSYPHSFEVHKLAAEYYFSLDENEKGLSELMQSFDPSKTTFQDIMPLVRKLYNAEMYGDVIGELRKHEFSGSPEFEFYYGASMCEQGDYDSALKHLNAAANNGYNEADLYYYRALSYYSLFEKSKLTKKDYLAAAEMNAEASFIKRGDDILCKKLLLNIYNTQGKYEQAGKISRDLLN